MDEQAQIELRGSVEDVTFYRPDTGFTVLDLNSEGELVTVVGVLPALSAGEELPMFSAPANAGRSVLPALSAGEELRLMGHWDVHASFGRQFRAELCERSLPSTAGQLLKYLSSGAVKGIRAATAEKIVEAFGDRTFDILENEPERLATIKGISREKAHKICEEFKKQFAVREVMIALESIGMTPAECLAAFRKFGASAIDRIHENPYILCSEDIHMGFERADVIAQAMPNRPDAIHRVRAGVIYVLRHNLHNGHTCIPREKLLTPSRDLLNTDTDTIEIALDGLLEDRQLVSKTIGSREFIFLPSVYSAEKSAAERIRIMLRFPPAGKLALEKEIQRVEQESGIQYEEKQRLAITTAVQKGLLILTGGPGTGKTTTLKGILTLFERDGLDVALAAPTGRAAKRMSELTGKEAKTIHRLLEVEWTENDRPVFARDARNPLEADAVIVDELSMVDINLFSSLLDALPLGCRLVMVGDSDQLPPVGAGNVLQDLIQSGLLPTVQLTEVFRQAMESLIVTNAHRIVNGETPVLDRNDADFFFMHRPAPYLAERTVTELCAARLPKAYGYSPISDIQVLCPTKLGPTGTQALNVELQNLLNPEQKGKPQLQSASRVFRVGDKVMQVRNNYEIVWNRIGGEQGVGAYNGDIGIVESINMRDRSMVVRMDDRRLLYPAENLNELEIAYAITVHKSQGSEFPAVVLPVAQVPPRLCYRNLFYTGVTRARKLCIVAGRRDVVNRMMSNVRQNLRYSGLCELLKENLPPEQMAAE